MLFFELQARVVYEKADIGIAFDGDAVTRAWGRTSITDAKSDNFSLVSTITFKRCD